MSSEKPSRGNVKANAGESRSIFLGSPACTLAIALAFVLAAAIIATLDAQSAFGTDDAAERAKTVTQEQTFMESAGTGDVIWPETFEDDEGTWRLIEVSEPVQDPSWVRPSETRTVRRTARVAAEDMQNAESLFTTTLAYDEGGWEGMLEREGITSSPEYETLVRQVDRLITLEGLPTNDVAQLPPSMDFEISSAETLTSTTTAPLSLSDVSWTVTSTDDLGIPNEYSALCNFRGSEEYLTIPGYEVTCMWSGTVFQKDTQLMSQAVYELMSTIPWRVVGYASAVGAGIILSLALLGNRRKIDGRSVS